ncbi:chemosensory pili system protein ChpB (putative protein-glutamate methylesterase) [Marinobacter persicus]|uniref:protein-glutamate methylesterase n=1 Tax=Marinobacter persicus TaxID=930118 RepID=A0A1I3XSP9_9GAMM|nr:chemotaxis protein CheB [Marinobacter persicus]GHD49755.1 protein-glutamate methylesterase [Marinobacter persicus]SFK22071.1 chemosensory pili system protein ChpB (putative protein-glutamate methylesterase) [Marinobacter persicus]
MAERPTIGIVADVVLQRHRLQEATGKFGLDVLFSGDPERLIGYPAFPEVALWLVTLKDEADHPALFDYLLEHTDAPVLFGVDPAPAAGTIDCFRWERRLLNKLEQQLGRIEQLDTANDMEDLARAASDTRNAPALSNWITPADTDTPAREIWVLGASLGGPAAVKTFLDHLPPGLPVGFVYAQHIDNNFTNVLTRILGRHAHYQLKPAAEGMRICHGDVVLMPVEQEWTFTSNGTLTCTGKPWPGPYGPSIDQALLNVAEHFSKRCHAIIFSGMGNDGAIAAPRLHENGSRIWVQNSASCGNSSMPDSVLATGCTGFSGTPAQLAAELVRTIENQCLLKNRHQRDSA